MGKFTWCLSSVYVCIVVVCFVNKCCAEPLDVSVGLVPLEDATENVTSVCEMKGCNCSFAQSDKWIIVNCTFTGRQVRSYICG